MRTNYTTTLHTAQVGVFNKVLDPDYSRDVFIVQNKGTVPVLVGFDQNATEDTSIKVEPGSYYEPYKTPRNGIYIAAPAGSAEAGKLLVITDALTSYRSQ